MTQPKFAPIPLDDEVRPGQRLDPPRPWAAHRPGEFRPGSSDDRSTMGIPGPDQGYVLRLARFIAPRLVLTAGEHEGDIIAGGSAIALRRAAIFGRAPVVADLEVAFGLYGYFDPDPPAPLVALRKTRFAGLSHDYAGCRILAHLLADTTLRLMPSAVATHHSAWTELLAV